MVEPELIRAQRYHDRATSLRRAANQVADAKARAKLKALAQEYESLFARIVKTRLKPKKAGG